jgi:hypothetical protein
MYTFHCPGASAVGAAWRRGLLALALGDSALCAGPAAAQAPGGCLPAASFTRTYYGSDGSVLSMRQTGSQVVGFSQDAGGARTWIFVGQRSGRTLTGNVVMLPRGAQRTPVRALTLSYSAAGSQLGHLSGEDAGSRSWIAKLPSYFVFPQGGEARFQSTLASDMDGAYRGNGGSRIRVRQAGDGQVFWYAERFAGWASSRPSTVTVGVALRGAQGQLSGQWWDLPSQTAMLCHGSIVGAVNGTPARAASRIRCWPRRRTSRRAAARTTPTTRWTWTASSGRSTSAWRPSR